MENEVTLTTIDNPFNPFEQFASWLLFDNEKGYNTCGKLGRIAKITDDMTDQEINNETERACDAIISIDFIGIYKKVTRESFKNN